jgi:repressor LexA
MDELTPRQAIVLQVIKDYMAETGFPPTRAEIAEILGFRSANAAEDHLRALARKGIIELSPGASRGIRLLQEEEEGLPVVGRVAAGSPILAEQHIDARYTIPPDMFNPPADYLLRVRGMSMRDAGILDDDLLAVHRTKSVRNGQIVVARVGNDVTVKRFQKKGKKVLLHPENPDFSVIEVDTAQDAFDIEGIGVGVIRKGCK